MTISSPAPVDVIGPVVIELSHAESIDALNAYRRAQHLVASIDEASTPPELADKIMAAYVDAAHALANHVSAAVRLQRGETLGKKPVQH